MAILNKQYVTLCNDYFLNNLVFLNDWTTMHLKLSALCAALLCTTLPLRSYGAAQTQSLARPDKIELVATDGASNNVSNEWGGHQGRITVHNDGTIRILYLTASKDTVSTILWRLTKRDPSSGAWSVEKSGVSTDDVNLVRDPNTDKAYVVAYPASVPTIYSDDPGPPVIIPGPWAVLTSAQRHYSAVGIGADGLLCFKTSVELATTRQTSNTETHFICGKNSSRGWAWNSAQPVVQHVGNRQAYDYLFPGGLGDPNALVGIAQSDLHKDATPFSGVTGFQYVFNGGSLYTTDAGGDHWNQYAVIKPFYTADQAEFTTAPLQRPIDNFINSQRLAITTYYAEPPKKGDVAGPEPKRGFYAVVSDEHGKTIDNGPWNLPPYGTIRVFEDNKNRMWLLWMAQGSQKSYMTLYPLLQASPGAIFTLGAGQVMDSVLENYSIHGAPVLAVPRTGQPAGDTLYASIAACEKTYEMDYSLSPPAIKPISTPYYPSGTTTQKILHFRIHLPQ